VGVPIRAWRSSWPTTARSWSSRPGLLKEYYKNPAATAEVLTADGWYHTGDAGFWTRRAPEDHRPRQGRGPHQGRPNDGAMFAPKYVENKLKFFPHIKEAVAFGDKREKVCAFDQHRLRGRGQLGRARNLPYAGYTDLAAKPEVLELIRECVEKVNADLAPTPLLAGSQISRFLVLHKELDADDGELTRTARSSAASSPTSTRCWSTRCTAARPSSSSRPR
jgi:long-chain acyl-CoA synthetase